MRLHALQYLRAVAALIVVYSHACIQVPAYQPYLMKFGSFGVDIFFVISGFIMMYIAKPDAKPGAFFMNRIRRVVPLYWFFTLLMAGLLLTMPSVFAKAEFNLLQTIQSLFFIPHFSSAHPGEIWPIVAPGWSLIYEMYFYALFGLSLYFAPKSRLALIALVITTVYFAAKVFDTGGPFNEFFTDDIVFEFIFGMLLAWLWKKGYTLTPIGGMVLLIAGFALLLLHSQDQFLVALNAPGIITNGIPATMVVAGTLFIKVPENRLGILLGDASYALYLCHLFILGILRIILPPLLGDGVVGAYLFVAICLVVSLICCVPVHQWIDDWLLRRERLHAFSAPKRREA
jgi:exopolysaccharide production protein ExoZ